MCRSSCSSSCSRHAIHTLIYVSELTRARIVPKFGSGCLAVVIDSPRACRRRVLIYISSTPYTVDNRDRPECRWWQTAIIISKPSRSHMLTSLGTSRTDEMVESFVARERRLQEIQDAMTLRCTAHATERLAAAEVVLIVSRFTAEPSKPERENSESPLSGKCLRDTVTRSSLRSACMCQCGR